MPRIFVLFIIFILLRLFEFSVSASSFGIPANFSFVIFIAFVKDLAFILTLSLWLFIVYFLVYSVSKKAANIVFIIVAVVLSLLEVILIKYFLTTIVPLGGDVWRYSFTEIVQTVGSAGSISVITVIVALLLIAAIVWAFIKLPARLRIESHLVLFLPFIAFIAQVFTFSAVASSWKPASNEFANSLSANKTFYFYKQSCKYFFPPVYDLDIYSDSYSGGFGDKIVTVKTAFNYADENHFPFLHADETSDVLSPFFDSVSSKPNVVIILVEGLGRNFANEGASLGNFTPFIDSLSKHSLYWSNFLSEGGRTFAVLPSLLGSLPFGKNGFAEMGTAMPQNLNLVSLFKHNGYHTAFYYGGASHFDNMDLFLKQSAIDEIHDENNFSPGYQKQPSFQGFSWGYGDKELFKQYLNLLPNNTPPRLDILLTVSTHNPFLINEQQKYFDRFEARLNELKFNDTQKAIAEKFKSQYASIMYTDDAIKNFITAYKQKSQFKNTIFLITGDHRMPEIPMNDKLERYRVPFIIYSPLLTRAAKFQSVSTHYDVAPSLLTYFKKQFHFDLPSLVTWMGTGLDTTPNFCNTHAYPIMQTKTDLVDFIYGNYLLNGTDLYQIKDNMQLISVNDDDMKNRVSAAFDKFKTKNASVVSNAHIIPDSLYQRYFPK